ncbi:MAG: ABC transporter ATP-binding protein [Spirochaetota bacterium]
MMGEPILRTEKLKAFYLLDVQGDKKIVKAVNDVSLSIYPNEVYGIAGESGCGKSTLLRALYNSVEPPLRLVDGAVYYRVDGKEIDVAKLDPEQRRRLRWEFISYVPQGSMSVLNPVVKLKKTYRDFLESHVGGKTKDDAFAMAKEHLKEVGLPDDVLESYPHQLSGGMRQRVTIALSAILHPQIMIADEPTTALDVVVQRGVVQLLRSIQAKFQNTIVMVTHDMGVHANVADRMGIMYAGHMVEEAPTDDLFKRPKHPYTQYLIDSLPQFGDRSKRHSVPGAPPELSNVPEGCPFHPRCPHAMDVCRVKYPQFTQVSENHRAACWLLGGDTNAESA